MKFAAIRSIAAGLLLITGTFAGNVIAQDVPEMPKPTTEHQWLDKFTGKWATDCSAKMGPDQADVECKGHMTSRSVGGFWVINEMKGEMSGMPMIGVQTIGYDKAKGKFVGTWIDSSNSFMWKYEGSLNKEKTTLTLEAEGPNFFVDGKMANFRDIYEFTSDDQFLLKSQIESEDGQWITFMSGTATRQSK
ncbi:DUF1579 domain-containing protein [Stieleria sp. JC731]|uniref:DUF1579 domain-containing protein n=1 Tax=Pirellulaceae TaxID=2691357 RepID=UPI001E39441E|nr:DUF1579 domain-containing protein [Stieleria sp. JC731]MCC9600940.1 DUF1579 domain-containing protein [Stieleria sp. JC731]